MEEMSIERKLVLCALLCLLVIGCQASAADRPKELTLEDCIKLATSAPGSISRARRDVSIAQAGVASARAAFLPQAQITNAFVYNTPANPGESLDIPSTGSFVALNGVREYESFGAAVTEIDTSGRLRAALQRAKADRQIAKTSVVLSVRDLKRAVTSAYYTVLLARHLVQVEQALVREAEDFAKRTSDLYSNGETSRIDPLKANAQVEHFRSALNAAELNARTANFDLASFWTDDVETDLPIVDTLTTEGPSPPSVAGRPFLNRPEYSLFSAQEMGFKADARGIRANLYPQLGVTFEYGIDANRIAWRDRGAALIANLNIPLFDWFRTRNNAKQFELRAEQVQIDREVATRQFSREYYAALARVQAISGQTTLVSGQVRDLKQNLDLVKLRYENGESLALEVVDAENQLAQAQVEYYTLLFDYEIAKSDLEVASGR